MRQAQLSKRAGGGGAGSKVEEADRGLLRGKGAAAGGGVQRAGSVEVYGEQEGFEDDDDDDDDSPTDKYAAKTQQRRN